MKKILIILSVVLFAGIMNACTSDEISPNDPAPDPGGTVQRP
jgi:hypothetical protein